MINARNARERTVAWLVDECQCDTPPGTLCPGHPVTPAIEAPMVQRHPSTSARLCASLPPYPTPPLPNAPRHSASTSMPPEEPGAVRARYRTSHGGDTVDTDDSLVFSSPRGSNTTCVLPDGWCNNEQLPPPPTSGARAVSSRHGTGRAGKPRPAGRTRTATSGCPRAPSSGASGASRARASDKSTVSPPGKAAVTLPVRALPAPPSSAATAYCRTWPAVTSAAILSLRTTQPVPVEGKPPALGAVK